MARVSFLFVMLIFSILELFGQDALTVSSKDMTGVIFRYVGDNETVVEVQSNVKLEFESTMDKVVNVHKTYEENGFFFYELLFSTNPPNVPTKYDGRKLIIKSYGFQYYKEPLDLKEKIPVGLYVEGNKKKFQGRKIAIQRLSNETAYARGIFYDKENDPIGKQAFTILSTKLASTNKFSLLEWNENQKEWGISDYQKMGIDYVIKGTITEFGRKNENIKKKKYQIAQANIGIQLIDVSTGQVVYAEEAKGEAKTDGKKTDYDPALVDKAISDAISKLVNKINNLIN